MVYQWYIYAYIGSMRRLYIHLHENHKKSSVHVGKYNSPMDPMGYTVNIIDDI